MQILRYIDLKPWHTLQAQAEADTLMLISEIEALHAVPTDAFILGGGSNTLFIGSITRPIVHLTLRGRSIIREDKQHIYYRVAAGECWQDIVRESSNAGWYGLENLAAIPGSVGAAPIQNIGAYGIEVAQSIAAVEVYDRHTHNSHTLTAQQCHFSYRQSQFKQAWKDRYIITHVTFALNKQATPNTDYPDLAQYTPHPHTAAEVCRAVTEIRQHKLPDPATLPNAGSFFHNPICERTQAAMLKTAYPDMPQYPTSNGQYKISAAWCIEQCGFKGQYDGAVGMYEGHALILINRGGTGEAILRYAARVQESVRQRFNLELHIEPTIIGTPS